MRIFRTMLLVLTVLVMNIAPLAPAQAWGIKAGTVAVATCMKAQPCRAFAADKGMDAAVFLIERYGARAVAACLSSARCAGGVTGAITSGAAGSLLDRYFSDMVDDPTGPSLSDMNKVRPSRIAQWQRDNDWFNAEEEKASIGADSRHDIYVDADGNLWVGNKRGDGEPEPLGINVDKLE